MVKYIEGNILDITNGIICHQVNTQGVMGAGLAKQIRDKWPNVYFDYKGVLREYGNEIFGHSSYSFVEMGVGDGGDRVAVANLYAQNSYGYHGVYTDYDALRSALEDVRENAMGFAPNHFLQMLVGLPVYIPYGLGCGLAGGEWSRVAKIIDDVFGESDVECYVIKYSYLAKYNNVNYNER